MRLLGKEVDCGCENRKEIMGAGNWQVDIGIMVGIVILAAVLWKVQIT